MSTLRIRALRVILVTVLFLACTGAVYAQTGTTPVGGNGTTPAGGNGTTPAGGNGTTPVGGNASDDGAIPVLQNPLNHINSLPELLHAILQAVVELGSILLVVMLVWVGFLFVMAQGNPEGISKARSALIWTLIGGLILLGAEAISLVVQATVSQL